jgi:hypothetical protein
MKWQGEIQLLQVPTTFLREWAIDLLGQFNSKTVKYMVVLEDRFSKKVIVWKMNNMPNTKTILNNLQN